MKDGAIKEYGLHPHWLTKNGKSKEVCDEKKKRETS